MDYIPWRTLLFPAAATRVMVAETVQSNIPNRRKPLNQKRFAKRYPNIIDSQVPTSKIVYVQVGGVFNGVGVFG
jgi:hypothetical protein